MDKEPLISIIVPTRNSEATLEKCLASIRDQTYRNKEVIVVDNYSTDRTKEIAESFGFRFYHKGPERNPQRNFGAAQAKGEYLLFIDSDMELSPGVVADCMAKIQAEGVQAVTIPEVSFGEGFWTKCKAFERSFYMDEDTMALSRFFDRDAFAGAGGFDDSLIGFDDRDLHFRIIANGGRVGKASAVIQHNEGRARIPRLMKKKYLYGKSLNQYLKKHPAEGNTRWLFYRLTFIKHWGKMIKHPVLSAGMALMQMCELSAAGAGYIVGMVKPADVAK